MANIKNNERTGLLEKAIREKAKLKSTQEFYAQFKALFTHAHSATWTQEFRHEDYEAIKNMVEKYLHTIKIPVEGNMAVRQFVASYENMIHEYPQLAEIADADATDS